MGVRDYFKVLLKWSMAGRAFARGTSYRSQDVGWKQPKNSSSREHVTLK